MKIRTGQTVYETVISFDTNNNPVSSASFDLELYRNDDVFVTTISESLIDAQRGVYVFSWSSDTTGTYYLWAKNLTTSTLYISNPVEVASDEEFDTNIYVGL